MTELFTTVQNSSDEELKPCPYCKIHAILLMRKEIIEECLNRGYTRKVDEQFWVECGYCHIATPTYDNPKRAIMAWNRRE